MNQDADHNMEILSRLLDEDRKSVGFTGVIALTLLAERLGAKEFVSFLGHCVSTANIIQGIKGKTNAK